MTDLSGGDYLPPETLSSNISSYAHQDVVRSASQIQRGRSVSQPTSFATKKGNLFLQIPPSPKLDFSAYGEMDCSNVSPYPAQDSADGNAHQQMFNQEYSQLFMAAREDVSMGENGNEPLTENWASQANMHKPVTDTKYGYRIPASQPSSPVRSGYPPGQAPYSGPAVHQGRPRGFTTSDVHGHTLFAQTPLNSQRTDQPTRAPNQTHQVSLSASNIPNQPQSSNPTPTPSQPIVPSPSIDLQQRAAGQPPNYPQSSQNGPLSPFEYSPIERGVYAHSQAPSVSVGTPHSGHVANMSGVQHDARSPFQGGQSQHTTSPDPAISQQQPSFHEAIVRMHQTTPNPSQPRPSVDMAFQQDNSQASNVNYNQPTPVNYRAEPVVQNPVPHLENQAMSYGGVGIHDVQTEVRQMLTQEPPVAFGATGLGIMHARSATAQNVDEMMVDAQNQNVNATSRRSSISVNRMTGMSTPAANSSGGPMTGVNTPAHSAVHTFPLNPAGAPRTPDISKQVQEKLNFLDSLANSVAQARQEVLLGHANAADEYITDVGNAIIEKALSPENIGGPTRSINLQVPGLGSIVQPPASSVSPAPNMMENSLTFSRPPLESHRSSGPSVPALAQPNMLAPAFELKRAAREKRSAPESPRLVPNQQTNKHIKLEGMGSGTPISAPPTVPPPDQRANPGQLFHSNSFPDMPPTNSVHSQPPSHTPTPVNHAPPRAQPVEHREAANTAEQVVMNNQFAPAEMDQFLPMPPLNDSQHHWNFNQGMPSSKPETFMSGGPTGSYSPVPLQPGSHAPTPPSGGRESRVESRAAFHRPTLSAGMDTGAHRAVSTPTVPTLSSFDMSGRIPPHLIQASSSSSSQKAAGSAAASHPASSQEAANHIVGTSGPGTNFKDDLHAEYTAGLSSFMDSDSDTDDETPQREKRRRESSDQAVPYVPGTLMPPPDLISDEVRLQLDQILLDFLNKVCSNRKSCFSAESFRTFSLTFFFLGIHQFGTRMPKESCYIRL